MHFFATFCNILRHFATFCDILRHFATFCDILRHFEAFWGIWYAFLMNHQTVLGFQAIKHQLQYVYIIVFIHYILRSIMYSCCCIICSSRTKSILCVFIASFGFFFFCVPIFLFLFCHLSSFWFRLYRECCVLFYYFYVFFDLIVFCCISIL